MRLFRFFLNSNKILYNITQAYLILLECYRHFLENMLRYEINNLVQSPFTIMMLYKEDTTVLYFHLTSYDLTSKPKCIILIIVDLNSSLLV